MLARYSIHQCQILSDLQRHPFKSESNRRVTMPYYQITPLLLSLQTDNSFMRLPITLVMDEARWRSRRKPGLTPISWEGGGEGDVAHY
jgi:hypothetical protein